MTLPRDTLSIVIPVLNEAATLGQVLERLQPLQQQGVQVVVVDGGSTDATVQIARRHANVVLRAARGRARQMNAGAALADGDVLLFLHADTLLPTGAARAVHQALRAGALWGRFDVCIQGRHPMLRVIAWAMNTRSRLTGIATGDQAIFVKRSVFMAQGGFTDQPLMEDVEWSRRLRRVSAPACLRQRVLTSGRRWESRGVWRTMALMWWLRWRYWRGAAPHDLAKAYR